MHLKDPILPFLLGLTHQNMRALKGFKRTAAFFPQSDFHGLVRVNLFPIISMVVSQHQRIILGIVIEMCFHRSLPLHDTWCLNGIHGTSLPFEALYCAPYYQRSALGKYPEGNPGTR